MRFLINCVIIITSCIAISLVACRKFIEVDPPTTKITDAGVFDNDLTAIAVVTGMYADIGSVASFGSNDPNLMNVSKFAGLSADELNLWSGADAVEKAYYQNALYSSLNIGSSANAGTEIWNECYGLIYKCNQAIEGIDKSTSLSSFVAKQLSGETRFFRAFLYFYLVNLYGDVPLITGLDPKVNKALPRVAKVEVYDFIIQDLKEAEKLLSTDFLNSDLRTQSSERVRPTKWAATALLARIYLYMDDYGNAEAEATSVINQSSLFNVQSTSLNSVFLKNSPEAIWQLQPVTQSWNTNTFRLFGLSEAPVGFSIQKTVFLSDLLYNSFEPGDDRKSTWVGNYNDGITTYYFPYKYKAGQNVDITPTNTTAITEYEMILRLGEQYLIRAEARARQGNISGSVEDLNIIRTRARATASIAEPNPLPDLPATLSQSQVIDAVMQERRVELFTEWGHRWLDLKRTGAIDSQMANVTPDKGGTWETTDQLYPIPVADIKYNSNLVQNPGY